MSDELRTWLEEQRVIAESATEPEREIMLALIAKVEELAAACDWFLREIQTNGWADGAEILRRFQSALRAPGGDRRE